MSDGLTTPSALAAGLAGAVSSSMLVVIGGLAEIAAGSTGEERAEVWRIFRDYGRRGSALEQATTAMTANRDAWMRFMMREELGLEEPAPRSAVQTVAIGGTAAAVASGIGRVVSRLGV